MRPFAVAALAVSISMTSAVAQHRELDAHEHGVGALNIAIEGNAISMELEAPGADIVGFEHPAETAQDRNAIEQAIAVLAKPQSLFSFPANAGCVMNRANVELEGEEHHEEHAAEKHHDDAHAHEAHADEESGHTEFHAQYEMTGDTPGNITVIEFPYFETFPDARELEVQMITEKGSNRFEVERDEPRIDLGGMI